MLARFDEVSDAFKEVYQQNMKWNTEIAIVSRSFLQLPVDQTGAC